MAADIDALVALLRIDLHDEDSNNYRWEDATLERHIQRAVAEYSLLRPFEQKTTLSTTAGSRELDVSGLANLVRVEVVEYPVDQDPRRYVQWSLWADTLEMLIPETPDGSEDVAVYWTALHEVDSSGSSVPAQHDGLILTGAAGYAATEWASYATNRANVSGPTAVRDYGAWGEERLAEFREKLRRLRRLRSSRLYTPADGTPNQSTVHWEP
jgi:hypothetical protein